MKNNETTIQNLISNFLFEEKSKKFYSNLIPWLFGLFTFILYFPSLKGEFVWDDRSYFVHNDILTKLSPLDIKAIFTKSSNYWGELLPLRDYLYVLEYRLFGIDPFGYHLVSMLLFIASGFILYYFLHRVFRDCLVDKGRIELNLNYPTIGASIALFLFILNPIYVESVAYISGQKDSLSMLLILATIYFLYRYGRKNEGNKNRMLILGILFYYLSVLAKLSALGSVFFVPFLWLITSDNSLKKKIAMIGTWIVATIPVIVWFFYLQTVLFSNTTKITETPFLDRILRSLNIIGIQLQHILWPWPMTFEYPFDNVWALDMNFVLGLIYLSVLIIFLVKKLRSLITLGLILFGTYLLPTLQIHGDLLGGKIYDRYLAVPLIGIIIILILILYWISGKWQKVKPGLIGAVIIIGSGLGIVTHNYIPTWKNSLTSMEHVYNNYPQNEELIFKYATELISNYELEAAEFFVNTQMNDLRNIWFKDYFLGRISYNRRNFSKAYDHFFTASVNAEKMGTYPIPNIFLAELMILKGDKKTAKELLIPLLNIRIDPIISFRAEQLLDDIEKSQVK